MPNALGIDPKAPARLVAIMLIVWRPLRIVSRSVKRSMPAWVPHPGAGGRRGGLNRMMRRLRLRRRRLWTGPVVNSLFNRLVPRQSHKSSSQSDFSEDPHRLTNLSDRIRQGNHFSLAIEAAFAGVERGGRNPVRVSHIRPFRTSVIIRVDPCQSVAL